jgi:hypothetical protein
MGKSIYEMNEREREFERVLNEANEAKDRLARVAEKLEEMGYVRKARSAMRLVCEIEAWQNRRP